MKLIFNILTGVLLALVPVKAATITGTFSAQVEEDEIDAFSGAVDQAFFNVQGDDDAFTVYSLVDFPTTSISLPSGAQVVGLSLSLTQSNAFFSSDGGLEFFLASDTRAIDLSDSARYQTNNPPGNLGGDVVGTSFGTLLSLGTGAYAEANTGDTDIFSLTVSSSVEAFILSQIGAGDLLRVIATPADLGVQATYSGANSQLDPPSPPVLTLTIVPEPSVALLSLFGLLIAARRRR
ncbi:MAG: hypothetical protein AAF555_11800 [Verrucomicrobiota bacterium]